MGTLNANGVLGQMSRIRERANLLVKKELATRGLVGIVPAHGAVLQFLFQQDRPVPIKVVVQAVGRVKSTVTVTLNTLTRHGYVRKSPSEEDGRVTYVELTEKGRSLHPDFDAISETLLAAVYGKMARPDREVLVRLSSQLEENLTSADADE